MVDEEAKAKQNEEKQRKVAERKRLEEEREAQRQRDADRAKAAEAENQLLREQLAALQKTNEVSNQGWAAMQRRASPINARCGKKVASPIFRALQRSGSTHAMRDIV
jgi:hypothetical protein